MATVNLTTTPTQIDDGSGGSLYVVNTGGVVVELSRAQAATKPVVIRLNPGQNATIQPEGSAVTAAAVAGTASVAVTTTAKPLTPAQALAADPALTATYSSYVNLAKSPDQIITGAVTRDANGAATSAGVVWPDGSSGTYTATTVSTAFPGAVDAYTVTYAGAVAKTYTQPAVTRDASTGAPTNVPAMVVS